MAHHPTKDQLIEIIMDLGRQPEVRFPDRAEYLSDELVTAADLRLCVEQIGQFSGDNRAGIERTLHRISALRNRAGEVIGLTCRVGRAIFGTIGMIRDLVGLGQSILLLGRPGVGKTTALREIARVLADDLGKRVVIIDTSNEIAGDGDIPHPAIGRARRMQVARPELQHQVMIEAVENHMPEVVVIDEIGTELEALAARTIAERGVQLVGTAHGNQIENLIKNPTLSDLVGGIQSVTLGDDEARRRGSQKSVLERKAPPTFEIAIEMLERYRWTVHENVANTVDSLLRGRRPNPQVRTATSSGKVEVSREDPSAPYPPNAPLTSETDWPEGGGRSLKKNRGWRSSGRMNPLPSSDQAGVNGIPLSTAPITPPSPHQQFDRLLHESFHRSGQSAEMVGQPLEQGIIPAAQEPDTLELGPNGEDLPLHVYPYAVSRHNLEQVIQTLKMPIVITKDLDEADAVLALRSHVKNHSKLRHLAKVRQLPIYTVKSNSMPQVIRGLQRLLRLDDTDMGDSVNLTLFSKHGDENELEALEEARLAVEQIVLPKGQPVELLPRSAMIRKMQHELVEHYRLKSSSFGEEPNRRLRIYPA
ncbi:MAG: R3H domain-containing nucleic acid-binding protein [Leptolyngbyaceae bacterium]|nr:R3H domain-containing nucleic acid-binding protein [Leptolyngbyaceae bacterium]